MILTCRPRRRRRQAAFAIPLTLLVIHFAIVPFTGSSVNPARSIASAVIGQKDLNELWIYIVGPIVGGGHRLGVYRVRQRGGGRCLTTARVPAASAAPAAPELLRSVGLMADGPATFGTPVRSNRPGVYLVELPRRWRPPRSTSTRSDAGSSASRR